MKPEKQLYQWDVNQYLTGINPAAQYVDYTIDNEVIRLETDGTRCRIPDEVLQTYGGKTCYERYPDGTFRAYSFSVLYAPKPPDYIYTPEEHTTFEALTARVDAAIEEIKRRADSGEFTPVKGVDYFTDAEKAEMMESVSDGAIGEFRKVVDSATTEYNANASEKLTTYDTNAETKMAEFDANADALQTEVDRLRGECDTLAAENRKQENRIDALIKLNKGQTYDVLEQESEAYSVDVPSGSKYLSVDKVGGKSVVFEQRIKPENIEASKTENGITFTNNGDGTVTVSGTASANVGLSIGGNITTGSLKNKPFILTGCPKGGSSNTYYMGVANTSDMFKWDKGDGYYKADGYGYGYKLYIYIMSGAVIDTPIIFKPNLFIINKSVFPSLDSFKQMFPADYYPYSEPTIISSQTDRIDVRGKNLVSGFVVGEYADDTNLGSIKVKNDAVRTDYIPVEGGKTYCIKPYLSSGNLGFWADADKNPIGGFTNYSTVKVAPSNARYMVCTASYRESNPDYENNFYIAEESEYSGYSPYSLQQITTGFPVLNSAGSVYDYIDLNEGKLHQRVGVVDLGTFNWDMFTYGESTVFRSYNYTGKKPSEGTHVANIICSDYESASVNDLYSFNKDKVIAVHDGVIGLMVNDSTYANETTFKEAMQGVMLYYELTEEIITDITIPTELTDWIEVEAGGTVTFKNADESKQLAVPNAVSWVRKLNEVE